MPAKFILTRFGGTFGTIRFDEKSFSITFLSFTPYWENKPTNAIHADSPDVYTSDKSLILSKTGKIPLECDVIDGSVVKGKRQPILFCFIVHKPAAYKVFCEPETIHSKKMNLSVLNTITFYLEDNNREEVNFNGETLYFTLQYFRI